MAKGSDPDTPNSRDGQSDLTVILHHKMAISKDRHFGRGEVLGWSDHKLRVLSSICVETTSAHRVRFHVQKTQGLMGTFHLITREGTVCWVKEQNQRWLLGIELEGTVEKLKEYITKEDSCYLFFIPKDPKEGPL